MAHLGNILFAGLSPLADILKHCYGLNAASYWSVVPPVWSDSYVIDTPRLVSGSDSYPYA